MYIGNTPTTQLFSSALDTYNGDAVTVAFTLSRIVGTEKDLDVTVNGVPQDPNNSYTVNGNTLTFSEAPSVGTGNILVTYRNYIVSVVVPAQGTVTNSTLAAGSVTGDKIAAATIGSSNLTTTGVTSGIYGGSGNTVSLTVDSQGRVTSAANVASSGDVAGPASSTDNAIARFDSTTGKIIQNSTATLGDTGEAVFAKGTFGAFSGGVTTVIAIGNTLSNIEVGDPSTASSSGGIQFKGGSSTYNWVISGNGNVNSGIEITPSTTVNGTTFNAPVVKVTSTGLIAKTTIAVGNATPSTSGAGITFPATQSASSDANTLDDYEEGSFTFTGTGFTTSPTETAYYTKIGNQVTVQIPDITGTSNTTAFTLTGLPAALRSAQAYTFVGLVYNASVVYTGYIYGAHDNAVTVYWNAVSDAFTASGVKGIPNNFSITYTLA